MNFDMLKDGDETIIVLHRPSVAVDELIFRILNAAMLTPDEARKEAEKYPAPPEPEPDPEEPEQTRQRGFVLGTNDEWRYHTPQEYFEAPDLLHKGYERLGYMRKYALDRRATLTADQMAEIGAAYQAYEKRLPELVEAMDTRDQSEEDEESYVDCFGHYSDTYTETCARYRDYIKYIAALYKLDKISSLWGGDLNGWITDHSMNCDTLKEKALKLSKCIVERKKSK